MRILTEKFEWSQGTKPHGHGAYWFKVKFSNGETENAEYIGLYGDCKKKAQTFARIIAKLSEVEVEKIELMP